MSRLDTGSESREPAISLGARVSKEQRVKYQVKPAPNMLLSAQGLGGQLSVLGDIMKEVAKADGYKVHTLIAGISMLDDGTISFELVICPDIGDMESNYAPI